MPHDHDPARRVLLQRGGSGDDGTDGGTVTLKFQSLSDQPAAIEATEKIVADWNDANPDVQVEIVPAGWDGIYDKLITQFNGGAAPDIIHYEAASIVPFAVDGYLADLSEYMSDERREDIPEGILDAVTVDDQVIAYPTELQSYMVFANKTMLDAAGVEIPTGETMTWDELRQIAQATTKDGAYGLGWGSRARRPRSWRWPPASAASTSRAPARTRASPSARARWPCRSSSTRWRTPTTRCCR